MIANDEELKNPISNEVWHFYMGAAPEPETGKKFYVQSFPTDNLNAVYKQVTQLKSQLEREQKCVELAVEALDKLSIIDHDPENIEAKVGYDELINCYAALTKIKKLREQK